MKKKIINVLCGIVLMISLLLNIFQIQKIFVLKLKYEECSSKLSPTYNYLDSLTVNSFEQKIRNGERIVAYIGRPDCNDCIVFEPILEHLVNEYNLSQEIKYVNVKNFREESEERWNSFKEKYSFSQTPAFLIFDNGQYVSGIEWGEDGLPAEKLLNWFEKNDIL